MATLAARPLVAVAVAATAALAAAAPALAKAPPLGAYECTIGSSSILFGTLTVLAGGRYGKDDTKGTFTAGKAQVRFKDGISGWTIAFKGGSLNGISGRWYRATGGGVAYVIALRNPRDNFESIYCEKRG